MRVGMFLNCSKLNCNQFFRRICHPGVQEFLQTLEGWGTEKKDEIYKALKVAGEASDDNNIEEDIEQEEEEPPTKKVIVRRMGSQFGYFQVRKEDLLAKMQEYMNKLEAISDEEFVVPSIMMAVLSSVPGTSPII
jgi:hypothetical protein